MPELKGTKTEQNLNTAFAGESQAHTKYQYYASRAKLLPFLKKPLATKKSMPKSGSRNFTMAEFQRL